MKGILKAALFVGLLYAFSGKATQQILDNAIVKIKDLSFAAGATVLDIVQGIQPLVLSVEVTNSQNIGATINGFKGVAYILGQPVAQVKEVFNVKLKPGETVLIDIPIILDSEAVLNVVSDIISNPVMPEVNVQGEIVANSFTYQVDEVFTFST